MKNLGTSLRRGVILIIYVSHYIIYEFWLKTAPASRLGTDSKSITIQISNLFIQSLLKVGGSPGRLPPVEHPKMGLGPPNTCSKMAIRRLT